MDKDLSKLTYESLTSELGKKKKEFEEATENQMTHEELNALYKELKALQQEGNHRMIKRQKD